MMKAWQPVPTLTKTIIMFFILSGIFLGIGIPMIILSQNLNENSLRYDNLGTANCTGTVCNVTFEVTSYLQAPVFVYYEIHNFYQNHRLYASSYSYDQLIGDEISSSTVKIQLIFIGIIQLRPNRLQPRLIQESISLQHIPDSKPRRRGQPMRHDRLHLLQRHF